MAVSWSDHLVIIQRFREEQEDLNPNDKDFDEKVNEYFAKLFHDIIINGYSAGGDPVQ